MLGVLFISLQASGIEVLFEDRYYSVENDEAVFIKMKNTMALSKFKGTFVIPEKIVYEGKEYPVVGVGNGNNVTSLARSLDSIVFPKTLRFIESFAFVNTGVRAAVLPEGFERIGDRVFNNAPFSKITLPSTIKEVGQIFSTENMRRVTSPREVHIASLDAWCRAKISMNVADYHLYVGDKEISEVEIPEGVTDIGFNFNNCVSITSVKVPVSLQSICDSAFMRASSLKTVTFAENSNLKTVGLRAFIGCGYLNPIVFPEGLTEIKDYAFEQCTCERISIPTTLKKVGKDAWGEARAIQVPDLLTWLNLDLIYTEDHKLNKHRLFVGEEELKKLTVPEDATVKNNAFRHISSLEEVVFPAGCKTDIGDYAFSYCVNLKSISILCDMKRIGERAFTHSDASLKNIAIMGKLDTICPEAFYVGNLPNNVLNVYTSDISNWLKIHFMRSPYYPSNPLCTGAHFFVGDEEVKDLVIPEGTDSVYNDAFFGACFINSISLPESLKYIGIGAFYGCFEGLEYREGLKPTPISGGDDPENPTNGILYVPAGTKAYYEGTGDWNGVTIIEREATSAKTILTADGGEPVSFYDLMGNRSQQRKGISILQRSNGIYQKVWLK